jgi:cytochrome P450
MAAYLRNPLEFLLTTTRRHGDLVRLDFPRMPVVLTCQPESIEHVLVAANKSFTKDEFTHELRRLIGHGLLTSEGDLWRRERRLVQPAFHRERIHGYTRSMVSVTERAIDAWRDESVRDVHEDLMQLTLAIVSETLFSAEVGDVARDVGESMEAVMARFADPIAMALPKVDWLPLPSIRRFLAAEVRLDRVIRDIIRRRRADDTDRNDLLGMLLAARDDDGSAMTEEQVRDEVITLFLAGHETTALALSWTFYLLGRNPSARTRLEDELRNVLGGRSPTMADLPKLQYADAVISETMRLYPPAWIMGRLAIAPFELAGRSFPAGTNVWFSQYVVHRDPRHFSEPEQFRPERWLDGLAKRLPRFAYFPFGGGPRQCIGNVFAQTEAVLLLATIAQRYRLHLVAEHVVTPMPSITLRPRHGVRVRVEMRRPS